MHGHQIVGTDEEVDVVRGESGRAFAEIDAVQDGVEVAVVGLDLRVVQIGAGVLDRERMERERVAQDQ